MKRIPVSPRKGPPTHTPHEKKGGRRLCAGVTLWLNDGMDHDIDIRSIALLELIDEYGSITQAATTMGISYRTAWCVMDRANHHTIGPVVETSAAGAKLTPKGRTLVRQFRDIENELTAFMDGLTQKLKV